MPALLNRYATPLISGLFLVSLISGIAVFFHLGPSAFRGMHEWLSMVLILPFVLHVWRNWKPMVCYLRHAPMAISLALSLVAAGLFLLPAGAQGGRRAGPVQFQLAQTVIAATPAAAAPLFGVTEQDLLNRLSSAGLSAQQPGMTLGDIAAASGKSDADLAAALVALKP